MSPQLDRLADDIRQRPLLLKAARWSVRLIPDVRWTRRFPEIGPIRFRLRQQRWYLWEPFAKHDHFMLGVFDKLVSQGDVVFDIGANIGIYSRMLVQWFDVSQVVAFEPMSQNVELLRANIALSSQADKIRLIDRAVGDRDGDEELQIDDVRSSTAALDRVTGGTASAGRRHFELPPMTETVTVSRLDQLMTEHSLPKPNVIKIDTEGAEVMVLDGAEETLKRHQPRLTIATHGADVAERTIERLDQLGYTSFGFVTSDDRQYKQLEPHDGGSLANNNILASVDPELLRQPPEPRSPSDVIKAVS